MAVAGALRDRGHGARVSYSRKVFIPLTRLCRDCCHYCTFAHPPRRHAAAYLTPDEVLAIARAGAAAGCKEALFTLGDKPELRYRAARAELARLGHDSTIAYLAAMAALVLRETGLLPHVNPGVMSADEIARLRPVSVSQGLMLETLGRAARPPRRTAFRLARQGAGGAARDHRRRRRGGGAVHLGHPDRHRRDAARAHRGAARSCATCTGVTATCRKSSSRISAPSRARAWPPTPSRRSTEHLWTIAAARILFGPAMNIQAPPNLQPGALALLVAAGINDWGGVSPVTPDHVNPERPWPALDALARATADAGKVLVERLAVYPAFVARGDHWIAPTLRARVLRMADADGFARTEAWTPGAAIAPPAACPRSDRRRDR